MELPRALVPWGPLLEFFHEECADALLPLISRIATAIGRPRTSAANHAGQPDGFDGLSRRGSYERLLVSEWLLAEEAPVEFARRAATGEHSFLQLALRTPHAAFHSAAIVDAGPGQLGSPRIAHIAALIVLARRAIADGGTFSWCVAQEPEAVYTELNRSTLTHLLEARSVHEATDEQITTACAGVSHGETPHETWLIGGRRWARHGHSPDRRCMMVEDVLEPEARQLRVVVDGSRTEQQRGFVLNLPSDWMCTRLLRDPFKPEPKPRERSARQQTHGTIRPISNLLFTGARGLAATGPEEHSLLYVSIPQRTRQIEKPWKRYTQPGGYPLLAATRIQRSLLAVWWNTDAGCFEAGTLNNSKTRGIQGRYRCDFSFDVDAVRSARHLGTLWESRHGHTPCWHFLLGDGNLVRLSPGSHSAALVDTGIHRLQAYGVTAHYLNEGSAQYWRYVMLPGDGTLASSAIEHAGTEAWLGCPLPSDHNKQGLIAFQKTPDVWEIRLGTASRQIRWKDGRVHGVLRLGDGTSGRDFRPALVVQESQRKILVIPAGNGSVLTLPIAPEDIEEVVVDQESRFIAYRTGWGRTVVYALAEQCVVFEHRPLYSSGGIR